MISREWSRVRFFAALAAVLFIAGGAFSAIAQETSAEAAVKSRIETAFKQKGLLLGNEITVSVETKIVTLAGTVRTLAVKEQAVTEAQAAAKGFKVADNLELADSGLSLQQIAEAVMSAIEKSPTYFIFDYVGVAMTAEGVLAIKGWTTYPWSANDFVKLAKAQPGVRKVDNEVKRQLSTDPDRILRNQVAQLIYLRPTGPSFSRMNGPVHIIVSNGVVTLGGVVDKSEDIDGFERLVRFNTGAVNVVNGLQLRKK